MNPALHNISETNNTKKSGVKFADLHLHTLFSDSTYTPQELIEEVKKVGLSCISVVDHDTVLGIEPSLETAAQKDIEVLPGIELTAEYAELEIHILGYLIDYKNKALLEKLESLNKNRVERIYKIVDKLKDIGVGLEAEKVFDLARKGTVGRLHVARAMVAEGWVTSTDEAFQKYIGDKCPAYILGFRLSPLEAIKLIKDTGGIPILAHPHTVPRDNLIPALINFGIMGLEVYYPEYSTTMIDFYLNLANKYNLLVTGGSDCHGQAKPEVKIGAVKIPYSLVEKLKAAKERTL